MTSNNAEDYTPREFPHVFSLSGRSALVTGAGAGLGAAAARALAASGASVMVTDLDESAAQNIADEIIAAGGQAAARALDVRDVAQAAEVASEAADLNHGALNILINNAGAIAPAMFPKMTTEQFDFVLSVHLGGAFNVTKAVEPFLPDDGTGRILNVTSAAGLTGTIGQANYGSAKAGIIGLTKSLAKELARRQITVNALAPLAATAMTETVRSNEKLAAKQLARIAMGRWATPDEIAPSFVFFASDAASYITGQILPVDGGTVV